VRVGEVSHAKSQYGTCARKAEDYGRTETVQVTQTIVWVFLGNIIWGTSWRAMFVLVRFLRKLDIHHLKSFKKGK
jgi:hypothetical protein